jgi:HKD family nuclease
MSTSALPAQGANASGKQALSSPKVFINGEGRSVVTDLSAWLRRSTGRSPSRVHIVTGFISYHGLLLITDLLDQLITAGHQIRILVGVNSEEDLRLYSRADLTGLPTADENADNSAASNEREEHLDVKRWCAAADRVLSAELNKVALSAAQIRKLLRLHTLFTSGRIECRRYEQGFLHAKGIVVDREDRVRAVTGSSNLTAGGYARNQEFNAEVGRNEALDKLRRTLWWWERSNHYDLAAPLQEFFVCHRPELIYLRMLQEAFGHEVNAPHSPVMELKDYQRDGVARVQSILSRFGGALIADEVGLGKTYIAGECARLATLEGRPVIVVVPASLCKMWKYRLATWSLHGINVISYERLAWLFRAVEEDSHRWLDCGLLILDEAHQLRNPITTRMEAVRSLISANPATQLILITATPVNNDAADLFELLALADRSLEPTWIPWPTFHRDRGSGRSPDGTKLARILAAPTNMAQEDKVWFLEFAHARTLRRERPFIQRAYATSGAELPFPLVDQVRVPVPVTSHTWGLYAAVMDAFGDLDWLCESGQAPPQLIAASASIWAAGKRRPLTLAAYQLANYRLNGIYEAHPLLAYLIKITLCKRLESSYAALAATAARMSELVRQVLADLDNGVVRLPMRRTPPTWRRMETAWQSAEFQDDEDLDLLQPVNGRTESADLYDIGQLRADLLHDAQILDSLHASAKSAIPHDPKKAALADLLLKALKDPRGCKVVVFASARETTNDLGIYLDSLITSDGRFAALKGRVTNLGTRTEPNAKQIEHALAGFAPATAAMGSTEATITTSEDLYDILICTDKFSEGVNLQQAAMCVNYDLVWNPQRLGQRLGRIDRVGSKHKRVTCWTLLPDQNIKHVAHIMRILHHKATIAAETIGVPTPMFPGCASRPYTDLLGEWNVEDIFAETVNLPPASEPTPDRDHGWTIAWLGNADRSPAAKNAIAKLPHGSGGILDVGGNDQSVVFCFRIYSPNRDHHSAGFAQIYADSSRRAGHITLDTHRCLRQARIDPTRWIEETATRKSGKTARRALRSDEIECMSKLLDRARGAVADAHSIPEQDAENRIQLICWMLRT